ncbi:rod outer segment membrane protein 1 [Adelges cooleyi]|uniref:rod outer segment membrane protein 1 n=1 Tax=Adelges cooleyi TaxID=133065 RepID=UPI0021809258|nr:rod outer segment membrane protein 1 [Adelges cooleyi]
MGSITLTYKIKRSAMASITNEIQFPLYLIISATEIFLLVFYCNSIYYTLQTVSKELNATLNDGLGRYYSNSEWQHFWDNFQQRYYCCGNMENTDWFQVAWVSPIIIPSFPSLKKYTQENGKFIMPSSPVSCCLPENTCNIFTDCEQPDPAKYYKLGCYFVILKKFNYLGSSRFICYAVIIIQITSSIIKTI